MKLRFLGALLLGVTCMGLSACRGPASTVTVGPSGIFKTSVTVNGSPFAVEGKDGRLLIDGKDSGQIEAGDVVTVTLDRQVRVNGAAR